MADNFSDQELKTLFQKHLPLKPMPPELAERLKQQVLAAVAMTLQASSRPNASRLPLEASPTFHFVAEQPDDQELYDLFQKHMAHKLPSPTLAVHLQQQVAAAGTVLTAHSTQRHQSQPLVQVRQARWVTWLDRLYDLVAHSPSLALGGVASLLLVVLVLIGLNRTLGRPIQPPFSTQLPGGVTRTAPSAVLRQAYITIANGQAMIQKPSGQIEMVIAGTTLHGLAPGDRLITGESTAHIEYFPGQSTTVEPGAEVELQEYTAEGAITRVALLVHSGKTSHEVNTPLAAADLFEIRTPAAVASAKYTKLTVEVLSETQTHIETEAGTAQVTTDNQEVVIAAGQQMTATTANPWSMAPLSGPTIETVASPTATPTASPSATAITLMQFIEPLPPTSTATPDDADFDDLLSLNSATRETAGPAPMPTPTNTPVPPTLTATPIVPTYVAILVPTATPTSPPETPTVTPTGTTAIVHTAEPATDTPMPATSTPVDTTTPTNTPVLPTRTPTPTATPTSILVPTATKTPPPPETSTPTATPTSILVPTATKTLGPTTTPTATPTSILVPTATKTAPPTYTPTQTAIPTTIPVVSPTASHTPVPSPTPINTTAPLPTATNTSAPPPTATDTPAPTATPTDTLVPTATDTAESLPTATNTPALPPTATDTPEPTVTPTDTPLPSPTATKTPEPLPTATNTPALPPTATDTPEPTATDTPEPTVTPTDTPVPSPTATDTPEPTVTPTDTPAPPTATDTPEPTATPTETPLPS